MFTVMFWRSTAERAVKTAAQSAVAAIGTTAVVQSLDWAVVGGTSAVATLLSVLSSIASASVGDEGSPSAIESGR